MIITRCRFEAFSSSRIRQALFTATFLSASFATQGAYAASSYYVQVGRAESEEKGREQWQQLSAEYGSKLARLNLYMPADISGDERSTYRLQAGPLSGRDNARRICADMVSRGDDCFIVESAVERPVALLAEDNQRQMAERTQAAESATRVASAADAMAASELTPAAGGTELPTTPQETPAAETAASPAERPSWFARLFGFDNDNEADVAEAPIPPMAESETLQTASAAPLPWQSEDAAIARGELEFPPQTLPPAVETSEGRVDVAEAIPVPLSEEERASLNDTPTVTTTTVAPLSAPRRATASAPAVPRTPSIGRAGTRWAQIGVFENEAEAYAFLQEVRSELPQSASWRARMAKPYYASVRRTMVQLRIGPVLDSASIDTVCRVATSYNPQLSCGMARELSNVQTAAKEGVAPAASRSAADPRGYGERREQIKEKRLSASSGLAARAQAAVWVQLGVSSSRAQAVSRWRALAQKPALAGKQPVISTPNRASAGATSSYRLRVGPFASRAEAEGLSDSLKQQGVYSLVVAEAR